MSVGHSKDLAKALAQAVGRPTEGPGSQRVEFKPAPPAPDGGWSDLERRRLFFGLEHHLTHDEALSLEGENEADWRDQAERLTATRSVPALVGDLRRKTEKHLMGRPRQKLQSLEGKSRESRGIGNDVAWEKDLAKKLGIPWRHVVHDLKRVRQEKEGRARDLPPPT